MPRRKKPRPPAPRAVLLRFWRQTLQIMRGLRPQASEAELRRSALKATRARFRFHKARQRLPPASWRNRKDD